MDEIGTATVERTWDVVDRVDRLRITQADPRIWISRELIESALDDPGPYITVDGDVLTIRDDYGQRFIYRIRWDDYADGGYLAEWD